MKYISFPGKTFLIGEYAVLEAAPCIIVNTNPRFYFSITNSIRNANTKNGKNIFHSESPAGQWIRSHSQILKSYHIKSENPYGQKGGFGFSSAQFNLVYLLSQFLAQPSLWKKKVSEINLFSMWKAYQSLEFLGRKASGADLISQWVGDICLFTSHPFTVSSIKWPFVDLDFILIRTGQSLNTWEHLDTLNQKKFSDLGSIAKQANEFIKKNDTMAFVSAINQYAICLKKHNLVHPKTIILLDKMKKNNLILAAKGCGAMGAEVVVMFFHPKHKKQVQNQFKYIVADLSDLTYGIKIHKSIKKKSKFPITNNRKYK